ncbi:MAG: hypothetical protein FJW31_06315 [Acidobacteria bacterium]|nr:hypothetical protein [Acidobacteriota bacterium]
MISNPVRYASRYRLYEGFVAQNAGPHVKFWMVEVAYGDRPFVVTQPGEPHHLQLRTNCEIWHKENALNLLFAHVLKVCPGAQYFAWVDAALTFVRPDWAFETLQQLQHYQVVQMFSFAQDVGPKYAPVAGATRQHRGFIYAYCNAPSFLSSDMRFGYSTNGHPGYAWAARRTALDATGGLLDFAITGGADRHMACGLLGTMEQSGSYREARLTDLTPNFRNSLLLWKERAAALERNVGYVDALILHHWHGRKLDRKYGNRWRIYADNTFDPWRDLRRDAQGLYDIPGSRQKLRDDLRCYFRARNEDSIEEQLATL